MDTTGRVTASEGFGGLQRDLGGLREIWGVHEWHGVYFVQEVMLC